MVNGETRGAAEALAGALRSSGTALVIGNPTAGQAYVYREFTLGNWILRIASLPVETVDGPSLKGGLHPDIETRLALEKEKAYYEDPYAVLPGEPAPLLSNRPRMNEAELVRRRREGEATSPFPVPTVQPDRAPVEEPRELRDPVLVQAIDILKGIIIVGPGGTEK